MKFRDVVDLLHSSAGLIQSINSTIQTVAVVIIVVQVFSFGGLVLNKLSVIDDQIGSVVSRFRATGEAINSDAAMEAAGKAKERANNFVDGVGDIRDKAVDRLKGN